MQLVGSNFSFAKGNINEEVKQRLFKNVILKYFLNADTYNKSFTTYYYTYNLMNAITVDKNKTIVTRNIISSLIEYSIVTGFVSSLRKELIAQTTHGTETLKISTNLSTGTITAPNLEKPAEETNKKDDNVTSKDLDSSWKSYNILCDMVYDIILSDKSANALSNKGIFNSFDDKSPLQKWYTADNVYRKMAFPAFYYRHGKRATTDSIKLSVLRSFAEKKFEDFKKQSFGTNELIDLYKELGDDNYTIDTITQKQYKAVHKSMVAAVRILKNYQSNNIIANVTNFLLEYTLIEFDPAKPENRKGILYVDIDGLVSVLYEKYANNVKKSPVRFKGYKAFIPRPFFLIGTTYNGCTSPGSNHLIIKEDGSTEDLKTIYFASEKIGIKFTLRDWKYTRSFSPGEEYKFRGGTVWWKRPQPEPTLASLDFYLYGSGLLYNIADLKSDKSFNYSLIGFSFGATFFNGLTLSSGFSLPFTAKGNLSNKFMYNLSLDVPIIEYIGALAKKNRK